MDKKEKPSDTKKICDYIYKDFGVLYSRSGVGKLLRKNGIRMIRPMLIPGNPHMYQAKKMTS